MKYDNVASSWLSQSVLFCRVASTVTLLTQATFPLVFVWPASRWYYLPMSVVFHLTTWWAMDTGPYITLWLLLVAFLPLERIPGWVAEPWHRRVRATALVRTLAVLVPTVLVLRILWYYFPGWMLLPGLAALGWIVRTVLREVPWLETTPSVGSGAASGPP